MKQLAITLIEKDNLECPNIGTITTFYKDHLKEENEKEVVEKVIKALESHFDCEIDKIEVQDNLNITSVLNAPPLDMGVYIKDLDYAENLSYTIELQQTWIY